MQTSIASAPPIAKEGLLYDAGHSPDALLTALVDETNGIPPGRLVIRSLSTGDACGRLPDANAADPDAFIATIGSTAGIQTFDTAMEFDGATGLGLIYPPSKVDLVLDSHADWDATTAVLTYIDELGIKRSENLSIPNGGNATVSSVGFARQVISLVIPAQTSTGGTATLGFQGPGGRIYAPYGIAGISAFTHKTLQTPSSSNNEVYEDDEPMPVLRRGRIWVVSEDACTPNEAVYARCASGSGGSVLGKFRTDDDSNTAIAVPNARWVTSASAGGLAVLEVNFG